MEVTLPRVADAVVVSVVRPRRGRASEGQQGERRDRGRQQDQPLHVSPPSGRRPSRMKGAVWVGGSAGSSSPALQVLEHAERPEPHAARQCGPELPPPPSIRSPEPPLDPEVLVVVTSPPLVPEPDDPLPPDRLPEERPEPPPPRVGEAPPGPRPG